MDVMSPDLIWVEGSCYRLPTLDRSTSNEKLQNLEPNDFAESNSNFHYDERNDEDEDDEDSCELEELIQTLPDNRFKLCLPVAQTFWSKIIGAKGVTKKRIESDTKTTIIVPRPMQQGDIIIKGSTKRGIILAKKSIDAIVLSSRQKLVFTHFVSIPMNGEEIRTNFIKFKEEVLKLYGQDRGVDESIFQNPAKLHLTIGTLVLADQNERKLAEKRLIEVYESTLKQLLSSGKNYFIEMKGIEYMNDDPAEVDVLYGQITTKEDRDLIQKIADSIVAHFSHHKLIKSDNTHVKLHVTLMNTLFRDEELEEVNEETEVFNKSNSSKKSRRTFNGVNILQKFQNFYFGKQELKTLQLSVRFSSGKDGYYKSSCVLNL